MKKISIILILSLLIPCFTYAQTTLRKTKDGYELYRNGKPYYVNGLGGDVNLDLIVKIGGNSIRTWGVERAQQVLDEAQQKGLTVMLGFWLQHERHGFDYDNKEKVLKQLNYFKTVVDKFKNHPALLLWGIGNELNLQYTNPACWNAVEDIAQYIHQVDPNHPTSTVIAGLDSSVVQHIVKQAPSVDILSVNTYGDIGHAVSKVQTYGWNGAYMITEWGPNGHWESPTTKWNAAIEQTSTEKKAVYYQRYRDYIAANKNYCLGSYAFLWGAKQEYTETWYGLFSKDNIPTEPIDALEYFFTGSFPTAAAPSIATIQINNQSANASIYLNAAEKAQASVMAQLPTGIASYTTALSGFAYSWKILAESDDKKSGGDVEEAAQEIRGLISNDSKPIINFRAPNREGAYRLFVTITYNHKVAYANIPFYVNPMKEGDKQMRFIQFKQKDMSSFDTTHE